MHSSVCFLFLVRNHSLHGNNRRDRLPKDVPSTYWHKERTDSSQTCKVARLFNPVVAVKDVISHEEKFQSTSSCNISTVNALPGCKVDVAKRERGVRENKRTWGIEMNAGRAIYLGTYSIIDSIDHLINNCRLKYRSWKYWHSPMLNAMELAIVIAY